MNWGGEMEILALSEFFEVEVAVVSCESLSIMVYGEAVGRQRLYVLYTGQHYDPIVSVDAEAPPAEVEAGTADAKLLSGSETETDDYRAAVLEIAKTHIAEFAKRMSERRVKRIKCLGCGAILEDNQAFQEHCMSVEHDDDFAYECDEVEVVEAGDDAVPDGRLNLGAESTLTFYNLADVWFSPLHPVAITVDGRTFPSTEHHFQWSRFVGQDPELAETLLGIPNADELAPVVGAQDYSKQHPEWDAVKAEVLRTGIRAKVAQHPAIAEKLRSTNDKVLVLIDTDPWAGVQAGNGIPTGRNQVGEAWMEVRSELGP